MSRASTRHAPTEMPTVNRCRTRTGVEISWVSNGTRHPAVLVVGGWLTHLGLDWVNGPCSRFFHRMASQRRLIRFDLPGSGFTAIPARGLDLEVAVDAAEAVAQASGENSLVVLSYGFGDQVAIALAARRPDLVSHLVLLGQGLTAAQVGRAHEDLLDATASLMRANWRLGAIAMSGILAPGATATQVAKYADHQQMCSSAERAQALLSALRTHDAARAVYCVVAPTLILLPSGSTAPSPWPAERARTFSYRQLRLPVDDRLPFFGACEAVVQAITSFTHSEIAQLTPREHAVLCEIGYGHSNRSVAGRLGISEHTAAKHVSNLFRKLEVNNRCAAVRRGQQLELVSRTA